MSVVERQRPDGSWERAVPEPVPLGVRLGRSIALLACAFGRHRWGRRRVDLLGEPPASVEACYVCGARR